MTHQRSYVVLLCLSALFALPVFGQDSCEHPLASTDLKDLLTKHVSEGMIRQLITSCGLTMMVDDVAERDLKRLGATQALVDLVRERATSASKNELELRAEVEYWAAVKDSTDPAVFTDYLKRYPKGRFVVPAEAKLRSLNTPPAAAPRAAPSNPAPAVVPTATSVPSTSRGSRPEPQTFSVKHVHPTGIFALKGSSCNGTLSVSPDGLVFRSAVHTVEILIKDLDQVKLNDYQDHASIDVNFTTTFGGFKNAAAATPVFDAIDDVMRYAGKFDGPGTAQNVIHQHGFIKGCQGPALHYEQRLTL